MPDWCNKILCTSDNIIIGARLTCIYLKHKLQSLRYVHGDSSNCTIIIRRSWETEGMVYFFPIKLQWLATWDLLVEQPQSHLVMWLQANYHWLMR